MKYKISFIINTDADPSSLLDIATSEARDFARWVEQETDQWAELDDESPCVEEVAA
jgi:hypothetical protein|tara:strand:- start:13 stop:180 length:168 start_codon:yes stop_codon:yes gene_type:complete